MIFVELLRLLFILQLIVNMLHDGFSTPIMSFKNKHTLLCGLLFENLELFEKLFPLGFCGTVKRWTSQ